MRTGSRTKVTSPFYCHPSSEERHAVRRRLQAAAASHARAWANEAPEGACPLVLSSVGGAHHCGLGKREGAIARSPASRPGPGGKTLCDAGRAGSPQARHRQPVDSSPRRPGPPGVARSYGPGRPWLALEAGREVLRPPAQAPFNLACPPDILALELSAPRRSARSGCARKAEPRFATWRQARVETGIPALVASRKGGCVAVQPSLFPGSPSTPPLARTPCAGWACTAHWPSSWEHS